jgi:hypothetical protein
VRMARDNRHEHFSDYGSNRPRLLKDWGFRSTRFIVWGVIIS